MVKVSVVVPIYNVQNWLEDCMESLFVQTMTDCEFICVDDGSIDDSNFVVEAYAKKDKRFILIQQENKGLAEARNVGIRKAEGKYIAFLDADDYLQDKDTLNELYKAAEESAADFVTFDADCFYESDLLKEISNRDTYYIRTKDYGLHQTGQELFCEMIENDDFCDGAWVLFLKRDWIVLNNLWFVPDLYPEDCIWSFQCYMRAGRVRHVPKRYYRYRIRANSLTTEKVSFPVISGRLYTVREILRYLLMNPLSEREEKAICKFITIILWHVKDKLLHMEVSETYKLNELSPVERLLAGNIHYPAPSYLKFHVSLYMEGFKSILQSASGVILYGAGVVGQLVYQYMKKEQILSTFRAFAVSDCSSREEIVEGHDVHCIHDPKLNKTDLVIIAVTEKYQSEMIMLAREVGFTNLLPVDEYLFHILEEHYA